jgi:hypothetical protein
VVLRARVLEHALLLAGAAHGMQRALDDRGRALHGGLRAGRTLDHGVGAGQRHRLGLAAERLDAAGHEARVSLGLLEVVAQPLLVVGARGHCDVRLEGDLEPALGRVGVVEVLHDLGVALVHLFGHDHRPTPWGSAESPSA